MYNFLIDNTKYFQINIVKLFTLIYIDNQERHTHLR